MRKSMLKATAFVSGCLVAAAFAGNPAVGAGDGKKAAPDVTKAAPDGKKSQEYNPRISGPSDDANRAIRGFRVPRGLSVELFAAEPLVANPVAFCIDEKGVCYVAETFRLSEGVTDTREHMNWLDADLASRTVADRVAMYRKYLGKEFAHFNAQHERVRRLVDRDGDGRAEQATVFADGFNDPAAGIGAGCWRTTARSGMPAFPGCSHSVIETATAGPMSGPYCTTATAYTSGLSGTISTACSSAPMGSFISASAIAAST